MLYDKKVAIMTAGLAERLSPCIIPWEKRQSRRDMCFQHIRPLSGVGQTCTGRKSASGSDSGAGPLALREQKGACSHPPRIRCQPAFVSSHQPECPVRKTTSRVSNPLLTTGGFFWVVLPHPLSFNKPFPRSLLPSC